jgi:hypothetical protein
MNKKEVTFTRIPVPKNFLFMPFYNYFLLIIVLSLIILSVRFFVLRRENISLELYVEALRNENSGYFEVALINYEAALDEVKKIRFHSILKNRIIEKLKLLHTIIEYNNNLHLMRWDKGECYNGPEENYVNLIKSTVGHVKLQNQFA